MSESTLQLVGRIQARLRATIRRITLADLAAGAALSLGVLAALWAVAAAVEAGFWLAPAARTGVFWTLAAVALGLGAFFVAGPLLRLAGVLPAPADEAVAARIGDRFPEVSDRLVNLLDLTRGRRSEAPDAFVDHAVRRLSDEVGPVPFEHVEDFGRARRASRWAAVPVLALVVFLVAAPGTFLGASQRLLSPGTHFARPAPFTLEVTPGDAALVRGEPLAVRAAARGEAVPRTAVLVLRNEGEDAVEEIPLAADSSGAFAHTVANVRRAMRYRVVAEAVESPWYTVEVASRPLVRGLQVVLTPPAYTGLPPQRLEPNAGDVAALPGTRVSVEVSAGGEDVAEALLRFDDGEETPLELDGRTAAGAFTLRRTGTYEVVLRAAAGTENADPIAYGLTLLADAYPAVALLEPGAVTDLNESLATRLRARITDDFGFARLRLQYRLAESRFGTPDSAWRALDLPLDAPRRLDQEIARVWRLAEDTPLDPAPGDVVEYYVQVWDNDAVAGYKSARSPVQRLRLPSLAEQYEALDERQDDAGADMQRLLDEADAVREEFETLRDEVRRKQDADWEDARQLDNLRERQQQLERRADALGDALEEMTRQMEENDLVSEETLQKYRDLQEVAREINSPELQDALRKLQEAMQNLDLQQLQQSLQDFEFSEEQYRQRLERTLELFENIRMQQRLEEAARRAEELARQQERLAEETADLQNEGEQSEGEQNEGEQNEGEQNEGEQNEGEQSEGEQSEGEQNEGEQSEGEQSEGEQNEGQQNQGERNEDEAERAERLAQEQERARREMEALNELLEEMREQAAGMRNSPERQLEEMEQRTGAQQMPQEMQQNAERMRDQQYEQAQQQQQNMQQRLQQMQDQMQQMQQGMQGQQMQLDVAGLRRALDDVLTLSQQQESLRGRVQAAGTDAPVLRDYAQRQVELAEGLSVVSDSLQRLARRIPQMSRTVQGLAGNALREMGGATEQLAERAAPQAAGRQKASMMHLNDLALLLTDLLNQMMNGAQGSGSGMSMQQMLQQMQQMAGQQQQLNQQLQQMLNDAQGNRLTTEQGQRLQQMAAQQEAIRRQLDELARNPAARGKLLGDLDRIAEQMEESIRDLQQGRTDRPVIQRQQQILTRLLDAQRSLQQRGREERREAETGRDGDRPSPGPLTPSEQAERLRRDLLRALDSGYAPDYEDLIKRYFERLQERNDGQ